MAQTTPRSFAHFLILLLSVLSTQAHDAIAQSQQARRELDKIKSLIESGQINQARPSLEDLLHNGESELGGTTLERAETSLYLALCHAVSRDYQKAFDAARAADDIFRRIPANQSYLRSQALSAQAYALLGLRRYGEVEQPFTEALALLAQSGRTDISIKEMGAQAALADLYSSLGKFSEASRHYGSALALAKALDPPSPMAVAQQASQLGYVLNMQGEGAQARDVLTQAIALIGTSPQLPTRNAWSRTLYHNQAVALQSLGEYAAAEIAFRKAIAAAPDPDSSPLQESITRKSLGNLYVQIRRHDEARKEYDAALELLVKAGPGAANDPSVGLLHDAIAVLALQSNDIDTAIAHYRRVVTPDWAVAAPPSQRGQLLINYGNALAKANKVEEAIQAYRRGIAEIEATKGEKTESYALALNNYGWFLIDRGRHDDAVGPLEQSVAIYRAIGSPRLAGAVGNLGVALKRQGRNDEALAAYKGAVAFYETAPPSWNNFLANSLVNVAALQLQKGELDLAKANYQRAFTVMKQQANGNESPELMAPLMGLAAIAKLQGDTQQAVRLFRDHERIKAVFRVTDPVTDGGRVMTVFYATDRVRSRTPRRTDTFSAEQSDHLTFGTTIVTIPPAHTPTGLELPTPHEKQAVGSPAFQDVGRHITIESPQELSSDNLVEVLNQNVAASSRFKNQVLVYIHGFNMTFENALVRMGQIVADTGFDGPGIIYSWASQGQFQSYSHDRSRALDTGARLAEFLQLVAHRSGARKIHIIAHSMGNRALLAALDRFHTNAARADLRLGEVVMAAPDVDRAEFASKVAKFAPSTEGVTLYASGNDYALKLSPLANGSLLGSRAGGVPWLGGPLVMAGVETIDVTELGTSGLNYNHDTYADTTELLADVALLMEHNTHPPDRRGFTKVTTRSGTYWRR